MSMQGQHLGTGGPGGQLCRQPLGEGTSKLSSYCWSIRRVNAEPVNYNERTALQAASEGGHLEVVKLLLEHKADVKAATGRYKGITALEAATRGGHLEVVNVLRAHLEMEILHNI